MRQIWVGCILLSTAVSGQAATLGRHSGAAVIGRALDIRVQALLAPDENLDALCVHTDVFYGDTQVSPSAVRVVPQRSAPDAEASLRVQSSVPVDEPVVTVYVRTGCSAPFSRRYVLLADPVTEPQAPAPVSTAASGSPALPARALPTAPAVADEPPAAAERGAAATSPVPSGSLAGSSVLAAAVPSGKVPKTKAAVKARPAGDKPTRVTSVVKRPVAPAAPRLELEPVDLSLNIERDPVLKMSQTMLSEPSTSEEERAAAARLWKAINASPEDILRDNQKLQVLEAEAKGLREEEVRSKAALETMQAQLEQSRYLSWLVYGLGAALLAALLALFYIWRKRGDASAKDDGAARAWWAAAAAEKAMDGVPPPVPDRIAAKSVDLDLDLDLGQERESALDSLRPLADSGLEADSSPIPLVPDKRDFAVSQIGISRSVATEELFDVQQQADFFISLGENEQAIQVLKSHLAESQEPSALAYLDLLKLYHRLDRRNEYNHLREDFNRIFNAGAPQFDQYTDVSRGLESYENAFSRIQALWPQPRVLDVIEQSIFRDPGDAETGVFDLEAYRELLLLHAIAKEVIQREAGAPVQDFEHTAIKPLKAAGNQVLATAVASRFAEGRETQPMDEIPHASPRLGLDVDLDELSEISAFEASLPEVAAPVQPTAKPARPPGVSPDIDMGNLIDFEMLDFMPPDEADDSRGGKKP